MIMSFIRNNYSSETSNSFCIYFYVPALIFTSQSIFVLWHYFIDHTHYAIRVKYSLTLLIRDDRRYGVYDATGIGIKQIHVITVRTSFQDMHKNTCTHIKC